MALHSIASLDDPSLAPYRELRDRELAARHGLFVAEGEHLVRRLLASEFQTTSILLADRRAAEFAAVVPASVEAYVLSQEAMNRVVGFKFHSGVLAMGVRKPSPTLADVLRGSFRARIGRWGHPPIDRRECLSYRRVG